MAEILNRHKSLKSLMKIVLHKNNLIVIEEQEERKIQEIYPIIRLALVFNKLKIVLKDIQVISNFKKAMYLSIYLLNHFQE